MIIGITKTISKEVWGQKELILSEHIKDIYLIRETPSDWAEQKVQEFMDYKGIKRCEIISVNDIVFCFGPLNFERLDDPSDKYVVRVFQDYAVFKKDEVLPQNPQ